VSRNSTTQRDVTLDYAPSQRTAALSERAASEVAYTEGAAGPHLAALGRFLIQTESVSSSKIERVEAGTEEFARALVGIKSNPSATSMVAATSALTKMVDDAGRTGRIALDSVLEAHRILMKDDPLDHAYAGRIREVQNWILGSDHSPRGAVHIPPPPELVEDYLADLVTYANRDDIPSMVQAAVAHAQFESIHPFTDGNGRVGRALINAVLRRRGVTKATVVPIATAMVADREGYFALVNDYRAGRLAPFVESLAGSAVIAAEEARVTAGRFKDLPAEWRSMVLPRAGTAADVIIGSLLDHPVITADDAIGITKAAPSATYAAMDRLQAVGVVRELTDRKRDRVWAASDILAELDDLTFRIAQRVRASRRARGV
jgi:Fic family protein